jgi:transposase
MLLMDLEYARKQLLESHRYLRKFIKASADVHRNVEIALSVSGVGLITAVTLFARIGDSANLQKQRELTGFVGLAPTERSSSGTERRGHISHLGDSRLRALLVEAAWVAIRRDSELRQFYHRIAGKNHGSGASKKAIVAVARKLTERLYRVLKDQRKYVVH